MKVWFQNYRQKVQKQQLLASIKANKLETCGELREADLRGGEMASVLQSRSPHSSRQSSDSMLDAACGGWLPADNVDQNQSDGCPVLSRSRSRSRSGESLSSGGAFVDSAEQEERHSSVIGASLGLAGGRSESLLLADPHYTGTSGCAAAAAAAAAMRRQRTSISAEQFDYLSAQYARLTHPTQEQLEHMSRRTGLHRRVVQVLYFLVCEFHFCSLLYPLINPSQSKNLIRLFTAFQFSTCVRVLIYSIYLFLYP